MLWLLIFLGTVFILLGFTVTNSNAKYLLNGINSLPKAERDAVDTREYVAYFRKFHWIFGLVFIGLGYMIMKTIGSYWLGVFIGIFPLIAYLYFIWEGRDMLPGAKNNYKAAICVLLACILLVAGVFYYDSQDVELRIQSQSIELKGPYGEKLTRDEIASIDLISTLPEIAYKVNGFSLPGIRKGYFKFKNGNDVKLLINGPSSDYIHISKESGRDIFYSTGVNNAAKFLALQKFIQTDE